MPVLGQFKASLSYEKRLGKNKTRQPDASKINKRNTGVRLEALKDELGMLHDNKATFMVNSDFSTKIYKSSHCHLMLS